MGNSNLLLKSKDFVLKRQETYEYLKIMEAAVNNYLLNIFKKNTRK